MTMLYDYYKNLLTDKQRAYFEDYYFNNLTLSEMAENYDVTRSAVNKQIKLTILKLEEYEEVLRLYQKDNKLREIIKKIDNNEIRKELEELI